ncbi:MAG: deoxyguanosinetriphosphate triphosphohydrolase [bacterium]
MLNPYTRAEIENAEQANLAPYAAMAARSQGRVYPQGEHPLRTAYQRDRDRIVHSAAFRRMEYKTQVFIPHEQDHFRTRLTHTLEVAQISRTMARALRLNEDLVEAVALVHDLGHTPFGHSGEDVLDDLLADRGGFNHNRQSLRVVDTLEQRYAGHPGLNLTYEVREGIVKHETSVKIEHPEFTHNHPTLEAALVDIADEIAYNAHDIDDGLSAELLSLSQIKEQPFFERLEAEYPYLTRLEGDPGRYELVRHLVNLVATDVIGETLRRLDDNGIATIASVRGATKKLVGYSSGVRELVTQLKRFMFEQLYRHPVLQAQSTRAREIIEGIYAALMADPSLMPRRFQLMFVDQPTEIVIADYIAGMTDRYAEKVYAGMR